MINNHLDLATCSHFLELKILIAINKLTIKIKRNTDNHPIHGIFGRYKWQATIALVINPNQSKQMRNK